MDDDDKKPGDEAAEPAPDAAQDEGAKLREVSSDKLKQILAAHKTWLETDGEQGTQADLSRTNLPGAFLNKANLKGAFLRRVNRAYPVETHTHYMLAVHSNDRQGRTLDVVGVGFNRTGTE